MEQIIKSENPSNDSQSDNILGIVSRVVGAYISNNHLDVTEIPGLINRIYTTFINLGGQQRFLSQRPEPAVSVQQSVTDDYIVCLEDGKKLKMLKRHLKTSYGMTPEQYRERWNLPSSYPMVAPNYAQRRSDLAKTNGLGHSRRRRFT